MDFLYNRFTPLVYTKTNILKDIALLLGYGGRDAVTDVNYKKASLYDLRDHDKHKLMELYI